MYICRWHGIPKKCHLFFAATIKSLQSLLQHSGLRKGDKFIRWAEFVAGVTNCLTDCLSRLPSPAVTGHDDVIQSRPVTIVKATEGIIMLTILQAARAGNQYTALLRAIQENTWTNVDALPTITIRETLDTKMERGIRYAVKDDSIVVPRTLSTYSELRIEATLAGIVRMKQKLQSTRLRQTICS